MIEVTAEFEDFMQLAEDECRKEYGMSIEDIGTEYDYAYAFEQGMAPRDAVFEHMSQATGGGAE